MANDHKMRFLRGCEPVSVEKVGGQLKVTYKNSEGQSEEIFDTVMFATGRYIDTLNIFSEEMKAQVKINPKNGKIITDDRETSSVDNIYAIGDCAQDRPELTPPAIQAGALLA